MGVSVCWVSVGVCVYVYMCDVPRTVLGTQEEVQNEPSPYVPFLLQTRNWETT